MKLHRFFVGEEIELKHSFWLHDKPLLHQWQKVLRLAAGSEVILFDGKTHDRLYSIEQINNNEAHLKHITDMERRTPRRDVYLFFSLLKKDKNDWILQKCTELGVSHFVPLLAQRSEKKGFDAKRAKKIIIEAAEQCGRSDIPSVRESMLVKTAIDDYKGKVTLFVAEQSHQTVEFTESRDIGIFIGPEGGWTEDEKALFEEEEMMKVDLGQFTLRAETAAVVAASKLV